MTSVWDVPTLVTDALCETHFAGGDGDCLRYVRVRLPGHVDARCGDAMLRYHALLVARPPAQPRMLQDHAVHARAFCPASLRECSFLLTSVRRCPAGLQCIAGHRFPIEGPYGALPRAAYPPSSAAFPSSHLISLPVVSRLRGRVCLGTLLSAGRNNNEISNGKRSRAALRARFGSSVAFCFNSRCARTCPRDGASAVPWRGTDLLQLHFQHTRANLHPVGEYSLDGTPYVFARR